MFFSAFPPRSPRLRVETPALQTLQLTPSYNHLSARGCGEIGRRARLRIWFPRGSGGSSPFIRTNPVTFDILPLRFEFDALDTIHFPAGQAANILRGALCLTLDPSLFSPRAVAGPSGLADPPRPFVFRCRHLDGATFAPGAAFHFDLNLFALDARDAVIAAFAQSALCHGRADFRSATGDPLSLDLSPRSDAPGRLRVDFLTPTELKPVNHPDFPVLFARIRDRVSSLRALYGAGPLAIDFAALGARAAAVATTRCDLHPVDVERRSSRTGQTHPIGGFLGSAEYEGPLAEFLPYLEAARWTGV